MCEVAGDQQANSKFDFQTIQSSDGSSCKANTGKQLKTKNADEVDANSNMPNYIRSSVYEEADKRASQVLT